MPYTVHIRNNETGEVRHYRSDDVLTYAYPESREPDQLWIWKEGNYSCDCNRALYFCRAADEAEIDVPCDVDGKPRAYSVTHVTLDDGREISIDEARESE